MTRDLSNMDRNHFCHLLDQVAEMGAEEVSPFGYGEPLIDKGITEKIRCISERGMKSFITTNASLLTITKCFDLIDVGLSHIRFSVHGVGKEYEEVHRNLKWNKTRGNILTFLKANAKKGYPVKVDLSFIPMGLYTQNDIDKVVNGWEHAGINDIEVWRPHNWTTGRDYRLREGKLKTCGRPQRGPIQINADGKMIVCCFDFDGKIEVGDTHKNTILEILRGDAFRRIREKHDKGDLSGLICETCDQLNEGDSPLLYSTIDNELGVGKTSSSKFSLIQPRQ